MPRYMVLTLGIEEDAEHRLVRAIRTHNPDFVVGLVSERSASTWERLKSLFPGEESKFERSSEFQDENDLEKCAIDARNLLVELLRQGAKLEDMEVNFSSGTKAMTAGLCLAAASLEIPLFVYVIGERDAESGKVIRGTERPMPLYPLRLFVPTKRRQLKALFNRGLYFEGLVLVDDFIRSCSPLTDVAGEFSSWRLLFQLYNLWDTFNHLDAMSALKRIPDDFLRELEVDISANRKVLGRIVGQRTIHEKMENRDGEERKNALGQYNPVEMLADIIANADRRAAEGKFDDAVARLYRACELAAQLALARKGIDTSRVRREDVPEEGREFFDEVAQGREELSIGMDRSFKLLDALGEERAGLYLRNNRLRHLLTSRNHSILAHGTDPVGESTYRDLRAEILELARSFDREIDRCLEQAAFPTINVVV